MLSQQCVPAGSLSPTVANVRIPRGGGGGAGENYKAAGFLFNTGHASIECLAIIGPPVKCQMAFCWLANDGGILVVIGIKSNQINFIGIKSSHRTVTSHMYTVTQEQSQT